MTSADYFQEQAFAYDRKRSKGVLGWLRKRERDALLSFLDLQPGETLLDAGCGEGYYAQLAQQLGVRSFGLDAAPDMIAQLRSKGIAGKVGNIEHFSLGKRFDKIVCAGVLEFTEHPAAALTMLARHLKPRGILVVLYSRPSFGTFAYVFLHRLHGLRLKIISQRKLHNLLKAAGLRITAHRNLPLFGGVARVEHEP